MKLIRDHNKLLKIEGERSARMIMAEVWHKIEAGVININDVEIDIKELFKLVEFKEKGAPYATTLDRSKKGDIALLNRLIKHGSMIEYAKHLEHQYDN